MRSLVGFMIATALAFVFAPAAFAGRIIVNHDEWTLSDTGASTAGAANVSTFIGNVASFMDVDGGACNFLVRCVDRPGPNGLGRDRGSRGRRNRLGWR